MDGFYVQEDFKIYTKLERESAELRHNRGDVVNKGDLGDYTGCSILN